MVNGGWLMRGPSTILLRRIKLRAGGAARPARGGQATPEAGKRTGVSGEGGDAKKQFLPNEPKLIQAGVEISKKRSQKRTQVWGVWEGFGGSSTLKMGQNGMASRSTASRCSALADREMPGRTAAKIGACRCGQFTIQSRLTERKIRLVDGTGFNYSQNPFTDEE